MSAGPHLLEAKLEQLLALLESGDLSGAQASLGEMGHLLAPIDSTRQLDRLRALHEKCQLAAAECERKLSQELRQSGTFRRAAGAYEQSQMRGELL